MAVVIGALVLGGGLLIRYTLVTSPDQAATKNAPRIDDTAWEQAAVVVCKGYVQVFNTETTLGDQPTSAQSASFLESIATSFDQMVTKLRQLPVDGASSAGVSAWFSEWDQYDAFGHLYADAVRRGAEGNLVSQNKTRIDGLLRTRNAFASANHMPACVFH